MANEFPVTDLRLESDMDFNSYAGLNCNGLTLIGNHITLFQDPSSALHAATKQYVDAAVGGGGPISAGRGIVLAAGAINFAQNSDYTTGQIPYASGLTTMGFSAGLTYTPGTQTITLAENIAQTDPNADIYFQGEIVCGETSTGLGVNKTWLVGRRYHTDTSGTSWGLISSCRQAPSGPSTAVTAAGYFTCNTTGAAGDMTTASTQGMAAIYANPGHSQATHTLQLMQGVYVSAQHLAGAGPLTTMHGVSIYMSYAAASGCTTGRALFIAASQRPGSVTTWWGIYQESSTDNNYLNGKTIMSNDETASDDTFSTTRLSIHDEGTFGVTSKCTVDIDNENTLSTGTSSATTLGLMAKARFSGSSNTTGADGLVAGYFWARNASTSVATHAGAVVGIYARGEITSGAGNGTTTTLAAVRARVENAKSGHTVTSGIGVYILTPITTGTITYQYGVYQAGTGVLNYWAGRMSVGTSITLASNYKMYYGEYSATDTSGTVYGFSSIVRLNPGGSSSSETYSSDIWFYGEGSNTLTAALYGQRITARHDGTATATTIIGQRIYANKNSTGAVTNLTGLRITLGNLNGSGAVTNAWGIYIDDTTATGTVTNRWGIYQAGSSDNNYFAGTTRSNMVYGHIYQYNTGTVITVSSIGVWYGVTTGWTNGQSNGTTPGSSGITITHAGRYLINWQMSFTCASSSQDIEGALYVGTTAYTSSSAHRKIGTGSDTGSFSGTTVANLSAADIVRTAVKNDTSAANITIEHAQVSLVYIGH